MLLATVPHSYCFLPSALYLPVWCMCPSQYSLYQNSNDYVATSVSLMEAGKVRRSIAGQNCLGFHNSKYVGTRRFIFYKSNHSSRFGGPPNLASEKDTRRKYLSTDLKDLYAKQGSEFESGKVFDSTTNDWPSGCDLTGGERALEISFEVFFDAPSPVSTRVCLCQTNWLGIRALWFQNTTHM